MKEFFGFGGYTREPEGYMSWQHLTFVTGLMIVMTLLAIILSKKAKNKNKPLVWAAILIDTIELFKIVMMCWRADNPMGWTGELPLFLCSIQLITIPLAAFSKGRVKEAAMDFVCIFGVLGAVLGTYAAGQNYGCYPVLSLDNVASGITHSISGFASLYILLSGQASMKKKNMGVTFGILLFFAVAAYIANIYTDANYMFLLRGDGTPYDIIYNLVGGNQIAYPLLVVMLFLVYIVAYYGIFFLIRSRKRVKTAA